MGCVDGQRIGDQIISLEHQSVVVRVGKLYLCACPASVRTGIRDCEKYRLLGVGQHVHTLQELVCHAGVGGRDDGKLFMTTLSDWQRHFTLIDKPETDRSTG